MKGKNTVIACLVGAGLFGVALWLTENEMGRISARPVAYIVCGDEDFGNQRVYQIDLLAGGNISVSDPIDWLGNPTQLAIDTNRSRLYIGSFRGKARDYYPVTVVSFQDGEFKVADRFTTNPQDVFPRDSRRRNTKPHEVYQVVVSPDGSELYLMHGGMSQGMLGAVWDASTGKVLRELERSVLQSDIWSPDGRYVAKVLPDRERTWEGDGRKRVETFPARVEVRDVQTGKRVSLAYPENGEGLHPPWGSIKGPLVRVHGSGRTLTYDRDTGEVVSSFNVERLTGLRKLARDTWDAPPVLDDLQTIALGMYDSDIERMFVVAIDVFEQREITRTRVGARCTNVVVAYE